MATIINRTKFTIAVLANEYTAIINSDSTKTDVPEDVALAWKAKTDVRAFIDAGTIAVATDAPKAVAPVENLDDDATDITLLNWRKVVAMVATEDDLDVLSDFHAVESRKSVLKAIESRMLELRA